MGLACYLANFTSWPIQTAGRGNSGTISLGSDWESETLVPPGFVIPANTISPALGQIKQDYSTNLDGVWDWLFFDVYQDGDVAYKLQAYFFVSGAGDGQAMVGAYDQNTSNSNRLSTVYRSHGYAGPNGIYFILADSDLPPEGQ